MADYSQQPNYGGGGYQQQTDENVSYQAGGYQAGEYQAGGYQTGGYQGAGAPQSIPITVGNATIGVPLPDKQAIASLASSAVTAAGNYEVPDSVKEAAKTTMRNSVAAVKEAILSREYQVQIANWLYRSWEIYKQCWWGFSLIYLFGLILPWIPIVRWLTSILVLPIFVGMYIATCNHLKTGNPISFKHMFHGLYFIVPLTFAMLFVAIAVALGFFLCIIPGLFLMVCLAFTPYVYVEYYCNGISVFASMVLCVKMISRHFFLIALYLIVTFLFSFAGILLLGVGILVTFPMANISYAFAVQEIFGLNMAKTTDEECIIGF
eukprot:TRINITY_DN3242_c0_g3_i1.p1 TRINITY_DN3242_c0_g3~~TRINITY_DN3242_c0_g3_i1.p1  ORF type:complete len:321 (+),score=60.44 TRINITY_DN3242_c0_g3_i1:32-994(+)